MPHPLAHRLNRIPQFDVRSRGFPIRSLVTTEVPQSRTWVAGPVLDQGDHGYCVGFSWAAEMAAIPAVVGGVNDDFAIARYQRAKAYDDWPNEEGSSVLAGAKAVQKDGYMPEYRWAFGVDDLALAVGHHGPGVIGINWYESMFEPNADGLVRVEGEIVGGHAIMVRGIRLRPDFTDGPVFRLRNSWGTGWGVGGDCYVSKADMARLLDEDGEACIPSRRNRTPMPEPEERPT